MAGLCQKSPLDEKSSVAGLGRPLAASASEQLGDVGGVEQVALVAELAVDGDRAFFLLEQPLAVGLPETDQGVGRTFPRATAMEDQRLRLEQAKIKTALNDRLGRGEVAQIKLKVGRRRDWSGTL